MRQQDAGGRDVAVVTRHMQGCESAGVLGVHISGAPEEGVAGRALVVAEGSEHEGRAVTVVELVDAKHHDELTYDSRPFPDGRCHVERVGIVDVAGTET